MIRSSFTSQPGSLFPAEEGAAKRPRRAGKQPFFREAFGEEGEAPEALTPARPVVYLLSHPSCWASACL